MEGFTAPDLSDGSSAASILLEALQFSMAVSTYSHFVTVTFTENIPTTLDPLSFQIVFDVDQMQFLDADDAVATIKTTFATAVTSGAFVEKLVALDIEVELDYFRTTTARNVVF